MEAVNPRDVLAAIFLNFPVDDFENDREKIHSAFSKIRERHFDLLKEIVFRKHLLFPRSRILDEVLSCLQPEFLGKINPTYEQYTIKKDELKKLWEKELKSSLGDKEPEIKEIANELKKLL